MNDQNVEFSSISDALDQLIYMHRDAHFSGSFQTMIDYYEQGGKGICPEIEIQRLYELQDIEAREGQDLAGSVLSASHAEEVKRAKEAYRKLQELYEKTSALPIPKLIADLILSEDEECIEEKKQLIEKGKEAVPSLIALLKSEDMFNPLFPGYGKAPALAAECLGKIGDERAVISLFESIGKGDFFEDEATLHALCLIGEPAKAFLMKVLKRTPITEDNEKAAIALLGFKGDEPLAEEALALLLSLDLKREIALATYLVFLCEGLKNPQSIDLLSKLLQAPSTPSDMTQDIKHVLRFLGRGS